MRLRTHPETPRDQFEDIDFEDSFGRAGRHGDCIPQEGLAIQARTLRPVTNAQRLKSRVWLRPGKLTEPWPVLLRVTSAAGSCAVSRVRRGNPE